MPIVYDKDYGFKRIIKNLEKVGKEAVVVGVLKESGNAENGMTLAEIAIINEYGTNRAGRNNKVTIPSRPFMRQAADKYDKEWATFAENVIGRMIDRGIGERQALDLLGNKAESDVKQIFVTGSFTPNSPATIAKKGSSTPLIDTGKLRQSITHRIERA